MPSRSVIITYTTHPPSSPLLSSAIKGIRSQLPLRNLHWKPSTRTSLRTIQELDVRFIELGEAGSLGKEPGGSVLESPLVNLCLVACENDEVYKTQTRSFIRDWLSLLAARKGSYVPLIVLVNPSSAAGTGKNVFGRDKGVFGKLKADFNLNKKERCVQLNLPPEGTTDPAAWPDVMNRLKESIVSAFDNVIVEREEDVKRGESQRLTVGWNFCTWFLLKESLAYSFEGVNLYEDALIVYEELEASFFQVLKEQNLSWFGKLGATGSRDDSLPILDTGSKPYRELLQTSLISIFDFRIYVFARQAQLLGKIGRITEIAKRGQWFVASLARRLRENEADLAEHFIESWIYSTCMNIVQNCDEWSRIDRPNGDYSGLIAYESARSELLDIARVQTERIGVASGHLPNTYPFSSSSGLTNASDNVLFESSDVGSVDGDTGELPSRPTLSNQQLLDAMKDSKTYREMYAHLTRKAISAYEACAKHNSVIRLKADLAALALMEEDWKLGYELCRRLAKDCAELEIWEPVARYALSGALRSHRALKMARGEDWVNLALAFLRVRALVEPREDEEKRREELQAVVDELAACSTEMTAVTHPAFAMRILDDTAEVSDAADVSVLRVEVTNNLPSPVSLRAVSVQFEDTIGERIVFKVTDVNTAPGANVIELSCSTSIQGIFVVSRAVLSLGAVGFVYLVDEPGTPVRIQQNRAGPRLRLSLPFEISLDGDQRIIVAVKNAQWPLGKCSLSLQSYEPSTSLLLNKATCPSQMVEVHEESLSLGDLAAGETRSISIPYWTDGQDDRIRVRMCLSYTSKDGQARGCVDSQTISTSLPVTVNVQDFFRPRFLISHFTIASDGRKHLRIGSVDLVGGHTQGYEVTSASKSSSPPSIVSPSQPLSSLFKITRTTSAAQDVQAAVLRLVIRYTCLDEEIPSLLTAALSSSSLPHAATRSIRSIIDEPSTCLQEYLVSDDLVRIIEPTIRTALTDSTTVSIDIESFLAALREVQSSKERQWRRLEIPVEMPRQRLLTIAHFEHLSAGVPIYEGRAIAMTVRLTTSFDWLDGQSQDLKLVFDVQVNGDDWIVLGKKKGFYIPDQKEPEVQEIVLVPVRYGNLYLPHVQVHPIDPRAASGDGSLVCETFVDNAAEGIEVLPAKSTAMAMIGM